MRKKETDMEQRRRNFREFDDIYRKYGKRFRFPVYLGEEFFEIMEMLK